MNPRWPSFLKIVFEHRLGKLLAGGGELFFKLPDTPCLLDCHLFGVGDLSIPIAVLELHAPLSLDLAADHPLALGQGFG